MLSLAHMGVVRLVQNIQHSPFQDVHPSLVEQVPVARVQQLAAGCYAGSPRGALRPLLPCWMCRAYMVSLLIHLG